jgi:hypothetical protein
MFYYYTNEGFWLELLNENNNKKKYLWKSNCIFYDQTTAYPEKYDVTCEPNYKKTKTYKL